MVRPRKKLPLDVKKQVLHLAGYKCGNPVCRTVITLDIHHMVAGANGGVDDPDNLLALCPNCHALFHRGEILPESIRAWKMLLLAINEAFDRKSVDLLLALDHLGSVRLSGDGLLLCASLIGGGLVKQSPRSTGTAFPLYEVELSERGKAFVNAWKSGDQNAAVALQVELTEEEYQLAVLIYQLFGEELVDEDQFRSALGPTEVACDPSLMMRLQLKGVLRPNSFQIRQVSVPTETRTVAGLTTVISTESQSVVVARYGVTPYFADLIGRRKSLEEKC